MPKQVNECKVIAKRLGWWQKCLTMYTLDEAIKTLASREADAPCLIRQHDEQLQDHKRELADINVKLFVELGGHWRTCQAINPPQTSSFFRSRRCLKCLHTFLWHCHTQLEKLKVLSCQNLTFPLSMGKPLIGEALVSNSPSPCTITRTCLIPGS